ncbi:MAG: site-2 protease family protein, partial [Candidatus Magasanikbacteria bacterium CG_4_9_14_0_2_um_filter_42_11]
DGSKVLFSFLPASALRVRQVLEQYGFLILIVFIMSFSQVLTPIMKFFVDLFVGGGPRF